MEITGRAIVQRIDSELRAKNLKRKALADAIGISLQPFTSWANRGGLPSSDIVYKIAKYFDVTMEWLLTGEAPESVPPGTLALAKDIESLPEEYREIIRRNVEDFKSLCLRSSEGAEESGTA